MDRNYINMVMRAYLLSLTAAGVQDPLGALTRVCDLWASLCDLLNVPIPEDVLAATKKPPGGGE